MKCVVELFGDDRNGRKMIAWGRRIGCGDAGHGFNLAGTSTWRGHGARPAARGGDIPVAAPNCFATVSQPFT